MKPDISIFLAGIRQENWQRLYDSIRPAIGDYSYELVIAGPYAPSSELMATNNVKWIETLRCPTAAYQQAALACESDLIVWVADDGWLLQDILKENIALLKERNNIMDVIVARYIEGGKQYPQESYKLHFHDAVRMPTYPSHYWLFNLPIMWKSTFINIGGFDAENWPSHAMAFVDIGVRAQNYGCNTIFEERHMLEVTQCPGESPEHLPIHIQQTQHDEQRFKVIYSDPSAKDRIFIDINNWKNTEEKWTRRFS